MIKTSPALKFFFALARLQAMATRRFDSQLGGLGLNEFIILFHLNQAPAGKLRRIDLAEKIGLTASGVTRLLLPMEKIGLIKRETSADDARVSYVALATGGKRKFSEGLERAELFFEETIPNTKNKNLEKLITVLAELNLLIK
jgi:DNA-binding MarR family transcriptional regulator